MDRSIASLREIIILSNSLNRPDTFRVWPILHNSDKVLTYLYREVYNYVPPFGVARNLMFVLGPPEKLIAFLHKDTSITTC